MPSLNRRNKLVLHKFSCLGRHSCWQAVGRHKLMWVLEEVAHSLICRGVKRRNLPHDGSPFVILDIRHLRRTFHWNLIGKIVMARDRKRNVHRNLLLDFFRPFRLCIANKRGYAFATLSIVVSVLELFLAKVRIIRRYSFFFEFSQHLFCRYIILRNSFL